MMAPLAPPANAPVAAAPKKLLPNSVPNAGAVQLLTSSYHN